jgi:hypothetical protein
VDNIRRRPDAIPGDCTYYCLRASILVNKVRSAMWLCEVTV